jgi:hypothetical protein
MSLFFLLLIVVVMLHVCQVWALPPLSQEEDSLSKTSPLLRLLPNYSQNDNKINKKYIKVAYPLRKQGNIKRTKKFSRQAETDELMDRLLHINREGPD